MNERRRAFLCGLYYFLALASYYVLKPVRESVFLHAHGYEKIPYAHLIGGASTLLCVQVYALLAARYPGRWLVARVNGLFLISTIAFWVALDRPTADLPGWLAWNYYVWVGIFGVFVPTLFWSVTHDLFLPEQGSRLYGYIGAGGILGAAFGGWLTKSFATTVGSVNLLLGAAVLLAPCVAIGLVLERLRSPAPPPAKDPDRRRAFGFFELLSSSYLLAIAAIVLLYQAISTLVDYQTRIIVTKAITKLDERTAFFGNIYNWTNLLALGLNIFVTGRVLTRGGPLPGLLTLPVMAIVASAVYSFSPTVDSAMFVTIVGLALTYSIFQSSKELLYVPTGPEVKFVAKGFIDTFLFRCGDGAAALWILFSPPIRQPRDLALVVVGLSLVLVAAAVAAARRHGSLVLEAKGA